MILSIMLRRAPMPQFLNLLSRAVLPGLCIAVAGYFGAHAVFGGTGILARAEVRQQQVALQETNRQLQQHKAALEQQVALLDPDAVDPDYADELVRRHLGVVRPDEVIIPIGPSER